MITITSNEQAKKMVIDGVLRVDDDLTIEVENFVLDADIKAWDIDARNIHVLNIDARNIDAGNINAQNIDARDIDAGDIDAEDIDARDIKYYAFCIAYETFTCNSTYGRRSNSFHKCLDSEIVYKGEK